MRLKNILLASFVCLLNIACTDSSSTEPTNKNNKNNKTDITNTHSVNTNTKFTLSSPDFNNHGDIPVRFSCQGANISPALTWSGAPENTKSFGLINIDHDAKNSAGFPVIHWVIYNIPAETNHLETGAKTGFDAGLNSYNQTDYIGMCPPAGDPPHEYYFTLFALDTPKLEFNHKAPTTLEVKQAMHDHMLAQTTISGNYQRKTPQADLSKIPNKLSREHLEQTQQDNPVSVS